MCPRSDFSGRRNNFRLCFYSFEKSADFTVQGKKYLSYYCLDMFAVTDRCNSRLQKFGFNGPEANVEFEWYLPETKVELEQSPLNMLCSGDFRTLSKWYSHFSL